MNIGRKAEKALDLLDRTTTRETAECREAENPKSASEITVCERYNEEDANITLISSDSVAFKVHALMLLRASSVFKNMVGIAQTGAQRGPLELTDEYVEHSQVVEATLDILYNSEITSFTDDKLYHHVIEFARKYDMSTILKTISNQIRVHASYTDKAHCVRLLRIAIDLGECDLMAAVVRSTCGHNWPDRPKSKTSLFKFGWGSMSVPIVKPAPLSEECRDQSLFPSKRLFLPPPHVSVESKEYIAGGKAFELGTWSYPEFAALPPPIAWALLKAEQLASNEYHDKRTEAFGRELQDILDSMYPKGVDLSTSGNGASSSRVEN